MNARALIPALVAAILVLTVPAHAARERKGTRLWLEAGPSFDRTVSARNTTRGYALAGGAEFGRTWALALNAGFEHYPGTRAPELIPNDVYGNATSSPVLSLEGGGNRTVVTGSIGLRIFAGSSIQPYAEFDVGGVAARGGRVSIVDPATGTVINSWGPIEDDRMLTEVGFGLRTYRSAGYDWFARVRFRGFLEPFELSSGHHGSAQIALGIVTP